MHFSAPDPNLHAARETINGPGQVEPFLPGVFRASSSSPGKPVGDISPEMLKKSTHDYLNR